MWFQWYYNFYIVNWNNEENWGNINENLLSSSFYEKPLCRREIQQCYPKQSTTKNIRLKKHYVNGAIEWLYTRCNHHVKSNRKSSQMRTQY